MILSMDGRTLARRKVQPLTMPQVRWFLEGPEFLKRAGDLYALGLKIVCQGCSRRALPDTVTVIDKPETQQFRIRCSHRGELMLPYDGAPKATDELLSKVGWTLACLDCARKGMADGVEGGNDTHGERLSINCGCTERIYQMARTSGKAS